MSLPFNRGLPALAVLLTTLRALSNSRFVCPQAPAQIVAWIPHRWEAFANRFHRLLHRVWDKPCGGLYIHAARKPHSQGFRHASVAAACPGGFSDGSVYRDRLPAPPIRVASRRTLHFSTTLQCHPIARCLRS